MIATSNFFGPTVIFVLNIQVCFQVSAKNLLGIVSNILYCVTLHTPFQGFLGTVRSMTIFEISFPKGFRVRPLLEGMVGCPNPIKSQPGNFAYE